MAIVISISCYVSCSKNEFSIERGLLINLIVTSVIIGIFSGINFNYIGNYLIGVLLVNIFSLFLVIDIIRLNNTFELRYNIDDYIIAALEIYIDIIIIFKELVIVLSANSS